MPETDGVDLSTPAEDAERSVPLPFVEKKMQNKKIE